MTEELKEELEAEIEDLKDKITDLESQIQEFKEKEDELNDTISELSADNEEVSKDADKYIELENYITELVQSIIYKMRPCNKTLYEVVDDLERIIR